ncbi:MAG: SDR family oxidoreductase [Elusimicrobia bacterium]|nr:SDR family oxidoreductase [Elusimicrobiota bacterium]MBU2614577.1 SDR family oxidoreductase [Elusimicrobiota bacterium]
MSLYLITGGAGFIGSHIADELVKQGQQVRILDNFCTGSKENLKNVANKAEIIKGDIRNERDVHLALKKVDYVLHQAALRSVPRSIADPISSNDVNVSGTLLLLNLSKEHKIKKFVYASSSSIYGDNPALPKVETQIPAPVSPYAVSKLTGEHYCRVFSKIFGLNTVSLRYFNVFGPRQDPESPYAVVIPKFINAGLKDTVAEVHGDGKQSRDFSYIENVVQANILAAKSNVKCEIFNIACAKNYSLLEVIKIIEQITGRKMKVKHISSRQGDVKHTLADISKAKKMLKYKVQVEFKEGMKNTLEYFKSL